MWSAVVDLDFLLALELADKETIEAYERLRNSGYALLFPPVVSHELLRIQGAGAQDAFAARQFVAKHPLYGFRRLELSGIQLDFVNAAVRRLIADGLIREAEENTAHALCEAACREKVIFISNLSALKKARWEKINAILSAAGLSPVHYLSTRAYLRRA